MGDVQNVDSEYFVAFISQLGMQSHRQRNSSAPLLLILMNKVKYIQFTINNRRLNSIKITHQSCDRNGSRQMRNRPRTVSANEHRFNGM